MSTINETYINALLADAAYVNLHGTGKGNSDPLLVGQDLTDQIAARLTQPQADFITKNFEVLNQELSPTDGFDAVVWRGKDGTDYAGKVYVSMRGTQGGTDIADDAELATYGAPSRQIVSMVNWWMRMTTPANAQAVQIQVLSHVVPSYPAPVVVFDGYGMAPTVAGTGALVGQSSIAGVNGHSLGGYLATAFTRLFGGPLGYDVQNVTTFNSAGFNLKNLHSINVESSYNQVSQLIGSSLGLASLDAVAALQTNYYGENGIEVTTNSWADDNFMAPGFHQYGQRVGLYQEDLLNGNAIANHSLYKQTDMLALGAALEKLDPSMTFTKLNDLVKAGSNDMKGSYEGVLDGLRRLFMGTNVTPTTPLDDAGGSEGPQPQARKDYQAKLKALADLFAEPNGTLTSLAGKFTITLPSSTLATTAKTDFAAFLSLNALSPVVISTTDAAAIAALKAANPTLATNWTADANARLYGDTTKEFDYSDNWYTDRAALLQAITIRNQKDETSGTLSTDTAPSDRNLQFQWYGANPLPGETLPGLATLLEKKPYYADRPVQKIAFGDDGANAVIGVDSTLGDHLYGGGGDDTLDGKAGDDYLEGGSGSDTYQFSGSFGKDTVVDADGLGKIQIDGVVLSGGKKLSDKLWESDDEKKFRYVLQDNGDLIIQRSSGTDRITIKGWQNNQLGIKLDEDPKPPKPAPVGPLFFNGDQRAKLVGTETQLEMTPERPTYGTYAWSETTWANDGTLTNGVSEVNFADVINASSAGANGSVIKGFGGNDALSGSAGRDDIFGDEGDDLIAGGAGSDNLYGGDGNDTILSATTLDVNQRKKPTDTFTVPAGSTLVRQGATWAAYQDAIGIVEIAGGGPITVAADRKLTT